MPENIAFTGRLGIRPSSQGAGSDRFPDIKIEAKVDSLHHPLVDHVKVNPSASDEYDGLPSESSLSSSGLADRHLAVALGASSDQAASLRQYAASRTYFRGTHWFSHCAGLMQCGRF